MEELLQPQEWETITGIRILDPDGWRDNLIPYTRPITRKKFISLANQSTANFSGQNSSV